MTLIQQSDTIPAAPGQTLLIADDDACFLALLKSMLSAEGYDCGICSRGDEALNILGGKRHHLLLTGVALQEMAGLDLVRKAKQRRPDTIAIVMTDCIERTTYQDAVDAGANDFIRKPFMIEELLVRIQHAALQERLRLLSFTDELTGLANRRGLFTLARQQMKLVKRTGARMALLCADLDNLKEINDTLGHAAGDQVLIRTAQVFREVFRDSDIICRTGGDEFAVIPVDSTNDSVATLSERIRLRIEQHNLRGIDLPPLCVSMGFAVYDPDKPQSLDELMHEADANMYNEKRTKRSRTRIAPAEDDRFLRLP